MKNPNILSSRYATDAINRLFSSEYRIKSERSLWIAIMKGQKAMGLEIPADAICQFEKAVDNIDLDNIRHLETITRHDVKARIEAFIEASGSGQYIHMGLTSRDVTDNIEQMLFRKAGWIIFGKFTAVLSNLCLLAQKYENLIITGRTHHQPAQPTLLGKRFADWAWELYLHLTAFENFLLNWPLRGIKGPVGTAADMKKLLKSPGALKNLEKLMAEHMGFEKILPSTGQVYYRSLDYALLNHLSLLSAPCRNMAVTIRLMAGLGLATEGFAKGQTGSSAMPHKMNCRTSERIEGLSTLLRMYASGASSISGGQWEEGDISCSVVRRVIIPDAFYTADGLCEAVLWVLKDFGPYHYNIKAELDRYGPFLATGSIMAALTKAGLGREEAHEAIKEAAVSTARKANSGGSPADFIGRLCNSPQIQKLGISEHQLTEIAGKVTEDTGTAKEQINQVVEETKPFLKKYEKLAAYQPEPIL